MLGYPWKLRLIIFLLNLICIGIFGFMGYLLDLQFNTRPKLLFVAVIFSFPFTQIVVTKYIKKTFNNPQTQKIDKVV
jgi:F0F1-type ATP synthase assembly protein I